MHTVPQNKDKFTRNNLFNCCNTLIFTHPLVYDFLCSPKHMATPVLQRLAFTLVAGCACAAAAICKRQDSKATESNTLVRAKHTLMCAMIMF